MTARRRAVLAVGGAVGAGPLLTAAGLALVAMVAGAAILGASVGGGARAATAAADASPLGCGTSAVGGKLTAEQAANAATVIGTGQAMRVPRAGLVAAIETALVESGLRNLTFGNLDSLGLFQQRPSQGWGTPAQLLDPAHASGSFYTRLLAVPGWQTMPAGQAAQSVQRSGVPGAYALRAAEAEAIVGGAQPCPAVPVVAATGLAAVAIRQAETNLGTLYSFGGSCTDSHSANLQFHCDCSSLLQQAWLAANVQLPRTSEEQYKAVTLIPGASPTNLSAVPPGALLFYEAGGDGQPGLPAHVAMYLGGGKLIEAPQQNEVVHIIPVYSATWLGAGVVR